MDNLHAEIKGSIAILKINRPKALNALNKAVLVEMLEFLEAEVRRRKIRAVILTGEGDKAFIAGADIKEMQPMTHIEVLEFCRLGQKVTMALEQGPFVSIAAVNGYALGGGLEMALACDFIYASKKALFGLPEVKLGLIPGFGGTQRLSRAIGTRSAKEIILTGNPISAEEAWRIGLVNKIIEPGELIKSSLETAEAITKHSETAVLQSKNVINTGYSMNLLDSLELERNMFAVTFATPEREKGMADFINKGKK